MMDSESSPARTGQRLRLCEFVQMSLSPEELYLQLGNLAAEMPDLAHCPITPEVNRWFGRACALVEEVGLEVVTLKVAWQNLSGPLREMNARTIASALHHALAKVELIAPARVQGSFIAAGNTLDAYAAVGRVLGGKNRCAFGRPLCG